MRLRQCFHFATIPSKALYGSLLCCVTVLLLASPAFGQADSNDGEASLKEAVERFEEADSERDFDRVADLCADAIDEGLDEAKTAEANQLWAKANLRYAEMHAEKVFAAERDQRWRFLRQQALDRLENAVELDPSLTEAHILIARYNLLEGGDREAASAALQSAFENAGDDAGLKAMAMVLRAQSSDDTEEQLADLEEALKADPDNEMALELRGEILFREGKTDEAIADYRKLAELRGNNPGTLLALGELLSDAEKYDEALAAVDEALKIDDELAAGWMLRAQINLANSDDAAAIEDASRAIDLDPQNIPAIQMRASALYGTERYEEALKDVEKVLTFQNGNVQAIFLRALIYTGMEKYDPAIEDMELLVANFPGEPQFTGILASIYNAADKPSKAIEIYNVLIEEDPEYMPGFRGRGDAWLSKGQHDKAIADYEAALKLEPEDDGILNNLAWVLSTSPDDELRDGKRALEYALKAAEMTEHKEAHILSTLAAAYAETGDFEKAVEWSEKSVELASPGRQLNDLKKELETFKAGKPVRERENVEDEGNADDDDEGDAGDKAESDDAEDGDAGEGDDGDDDDADDDDADDDDGDDDDGDDDDEGDGEESGDGNA